MSDRKKAVRVWSCDRKIRHGIVAGSWTELLSKIEGKFGYAETVSRSISKFNYFLQKTYKLQFNIYKN